MFIWSYPSNLSGSDELSELRSGLTSRCPRLLCDPPKIVQAISFGNLLGQTIREKVLFLLPDDVPLLTYDGALGDYPFDRDDDRSKGSISRYLIKCSGLELMKLS
jgi:hypothetical protein